MVEKILHIGPFRLPSNCYQRSLAFERLGYQVLRIDLSAYDPLFGGALARVERRLVAPLIRNRIIKEIHAKLQVFVPDLLFIEKGLIFNGEDIRHFRRVGGHQPLIAHLNPDDPFGTFRRGWRRFIHAIPEYDIHFIPKSLNRDDYFNLGARDVHVYDRSYDPTVHFPVALNEPERRRYACEVGFIGTCAPYREQAILSLFRAEIPVAIWGGGWPDGKHWRELRSAWRGGEQLAADYVKAICGMNVCLHFLRRENRDLQDSRTYEIPACGTFMLAERTVDHQRLFREDAEAAYFDSVEELIAKTRFYLIHQRARATIAMAGHLRAVNSGYDHDTRMRDLLDIVTDRQGVLVKRRNRELAGGRRG